MKNGGRGSTVFSGPIIAEGKGTKFRTCYAEQRRDEEGKNGKRIQFIFSPGCLHGCREVSLAWLGPVRSREERDKLDLLGRGGKAPFFSLLFLCVMLDSYKKLLKSFKISNFCSKSRTMRHG